MAPSAKKKPTPQKRRKPDLDLHLPPWLDAMPWDPHDLKHDLIHIMFEMGRASRAKGPLKTKQVTDALGAAVAAIDEVRAGTLRGARAARRIDALDTRLSMAMTAAHEATLITCPVCTTRVSPKTIADGPAVVLEPADSRWWTVSLPAVRGAYTQGSSPSASRKNLASLLHDFEGLRRDGLIAPNGPEDGTTPKTKSQAEGRRRYVEILVAVQRARICGSWSMAEVADDLASVWARLTPTAQEEIRRLTERVMGRAPKGGG